MNPETPINYERQPVERPPRPDDPTTIQPVDVSLLWTFAVLALLMSLLFVASIPLCLIALFRGPDIFGVICLLCAVGMTVGLGGTGIGLIRRARKAKRANAGH